MHSWVSAGCRQRSGMWLALALAASLTGCVTVEPRSHPANPLGWPARALTGVGFAAEDTEIPVVTELGRLLYCIGRLADAPALLVEGLVTWDGDELLDGGNALLSGTGETLTAALNVPFSVIIGPRVDIGRDAARVNEALVAYDAAFRSGPLEGVHPLIPEGARVRASGNNLIWTFPGRGEVLQRAEGSWLFLAQTSLPGTGSYSAQERSWGFVVPLRSRWDARSDRQRTVTILHEMAHQIGQIRDEFRGWSLAYWTAYNVAYVFGGYGGHWAERIPDGAAQVNQALAGWQPSE